MRAYIRAWRLRRRQRRCPHGFQVLRGTTWRCQMCGATREGVSLVATMTQGVTYTAGSSGAGWTVT